MSSALSIALSVALMPVALSIYIERYRFDVCSIGWHVTSPSLERRSHDVGCFVALSRELYVALLATSTFISEKKPFCWSACLILQR
jgi:hypothetical protein